MRRPLFVALTLILGVADAWAGWLWMRSREERGHARDQLAICQEVSREINSLRSAPIRFEEGARTSDALAQLVESSSQRVGLGSDRIVHISPGEPKRLGESPYQEQVTEVELREVTLKQLLQFALAVGNTGPGIHCGALTLRVPPGTEDSDSGTELWNAQVLLTTYIYAPKIPPSP